MAKAVRRAAGAWCAAAGWRRQWIATLWTAGAAGPCAGRFRGTHSRCACLRVCWPPSLGVDSRTAKAGQAPAAGTAAGLTRSPGRSPALVRWQRQPECAAAATGGAQPVGASLGLVVPGQLGVAGANLKAGELQVGSESDSGFKFWATMTPGRGPGGIRIEVSGYHDCHKYRDKQPEN